MENNKLQDPFFQQVFKPLVAKVRREQGVQLYIRGDEEKKTDKATRIEANLEPMNRAGNLILNEAERDNPHMKELLDQFTLFTLSLRYPADGPDAVEGGNRIIDEIQHRAEPLYYTLACRHTHTQQTKIINSKQCIYEPIRTTFRLRCLHSPRDSRCAHQSRRIGHRDL